MARRRTKPTGFSRKERLSAFTVYVVAGIGALIGAILLGVSLLRPTAFEGLRGGATDVVEPAGQVSSVTRSGGRSIFQNIAAYYRAGSKNAELEEEVRIARVRLAEARALEQENKRLKAMLRIVDGDAEPVATARLIGSTSSSVRRIAFLSAGSRDGVKVGMPVRTPRGLVGRVLGVGRSSARVLLLTDPESTVPVRRSTDEVIAFAEGRADGTVQLRLINLGVNPLKEGDVFVTSGTGGLYRPNVAVAVVSELTRDGAIGRLLANPAATDFVLVEPEWQPAAREAISEAVARREAPVPADGGE
ncbi:rod shape-determining protein MreC [Alteriqipengyuania sp. WL0013]|uniref:rod shape-determining protein MreC n=1 Tax=Alteriqipengyuania sp. WL0013 TaxID=3110773 RepID=UPI002C8D6F41|nr:rod shape-determining protein MreC [Alteriqipengyuania sp. WL0013]MEB3414996.1 rod shape-determining protein MreC [Alteriqipengyuania sp. WL0013]